jgi:hypothetical protein
MKTNTLKLIAASLAAGACLLITNGCATGVVGYYHTQTDMETEASAKRAGFRVTAFDPEVGGPSISADVGEIISNLYGNHLPSMAIANVVDIAAGVMVYQYGKDEGWWGDSGGGDAPPKDLTMEIPTSNGRDVIVVQGNGNTIDTASGHNTTTTDNHANTEPQPVAP